ncbi:MAG TPA: hypothetical protein VHV31_15840 [Nitrolancea sp.]|nr:hypothetical protein [Nitrolancea sp.]
MQQAIIRARQIKALYQRELTSLNRDRSLDDAIRKRQAELLWRQTTERLERLQGAVELDLDALPDEQRALFDPPQRPAYLTDDE